MSPLIFATEKDSPYDVEIANVGTLGGSGRGGIPVEFAARVVHELQDDDGEPLAGKRLETAARDFAEARGITTRSVKSLDDETVQRLREEAGAIPRHPSIEEHSRALAERDAAQIQAHEEAPTPLRQDDLPVQESSVLPEHPLTQKEA